MTPTAEQIALATQIANDAQLFPHIVCGIVERESSWDPWCYRFEPAFYTHYVEPQFDAGKLTITEAQGRAFSWGLMQTMGQSVREIGYTDWLTSLLIPETSLLWGCRLFNRKLAHADGSYAQALQLWNGGGNKNYAQEVMALAEKYQA